MNSNIISHGFNDYFKRSFSVSVFLVNYSTGGSNTVIREYTWGLNKGGGIGGLLNLKEGTENYSFLYDGKGNVMVVLDSNQQPVASYRYDEFGVPLKKTGTFDQPYRFSTKRYDEQTGLSYFGYRFYSPAIGRWMSRDPLGEAGGINLYGFVGNNAVNYVDPWGLDPRGPYSSRPSHGWDSPYSPPENNEMLRCHVATHNDPVENVIGAAVVGGPLVIYGGTVVAPHVYAAAQSAAITVLSNPATVAVLQEETAKFIEGAVAPGPPPPSIGGYAGFLAGRAYHSFSNYRGPIRD